MEAALGSTCRRGGDGWRSKSPAALQTTARPSPIATLLTNAEGEQPRAVPVSFVLVRTNWSPSVTTSPGLFRFAAQIERRFPSIPACVFLGLNRTPRRPHLDAEHASEVEESPTIFDAQRKGKLEQILNRPGGSTW